MDQPTAESHLWHSNKHVSGKVDSLKERASWQLILFSGKWASWKSSPLDKVELSGIQIFEHMSPWGSRLLEMFAAFRFKRLGKQTSSESGFYEKWTLGEGDYSRKCCHTRVFFLNGQRWKEDAHWTRLLMFAEVWKNELVHSGSFKWQLDALHS